MMDVKESMSESNIYVCVCIQKVLGTCVYVISSCQSNYVI